MSSVSPRIILLMGVAGSGKTTVGRLLAADLNWPYFEADDFHSTANKTKMEQGIALNDKDRAPWLAAIRTQIDACIAKRENAVFTCSALKELYRRVLMENARSIILIHLAGDPATIQARVSQRQAHYMKSDMVRSQFETLEVPTDALSFDIRQSPEELVARIRQACKI